MTTQRYRYGHGSVLVPFNALKVGDRLWSSDPGVPVAVVVDIYRLANAIEVTYEVDGRVESFLRLAELPGGAWWGVEVWREGYPQH